MGLQNMTIIQVAIKDLYMLLLSVFPEFVTYLN